jgi:hypothetical protein
MFALHMAWAVANLNPIPLDAPAARPVLPFDIRISDPFSVRCGPTTSAADDPSAGVTFVMSVPGSSSRPATRWLVTACGRL